MRLVHAIYLDDARPDHVDAGNYSDCDFRSAAAKKLALRGGHRSAGERGETDDQKGKMSI